MAPGGGANFRLRVTPEIDNSSINAFVKSSVAGIKEIAKEAAAARASGGVKAQAAVNVRAQRAEAGINESLQRAQAGRTPENAASVDAATRTLRGDLAALHTVYGVQLHTADDLAKATAILAAETTAEATRLRRGGQITKAKAATAPPAEPVVPKETARERSLRERGLDVEPNEHPGRTTARKDMSDKEAKSEYLSEAENVERQKQIGLRAEGVRRQVRRAVIDERNAQRFEVDEQEFMATSAKDNAKVHRQLMDRLAKKPDAVHEFAEDRLSTSALTDKVNAEKERLFRQRADAGDPTELARIDDRILSLQRKALRLTEEKAAVQQGGLSDPRQRAAWREAADVADEVRQAKRPSRLIVGDRQKVEDEANRRDEAERAQQDSYARTARVSAEREAKRQTDAQRAVSDRNIKAALNQVGKSVEGGFRAGATTDNKAKKVDEDDRALQDRLARARRIAAEKLIASANEAAAKTSDRNVNRAVDQIGKTIEAALNREAKASNAAADAAERRAKAEQELAVKVAVNTIGRTVKSSFDAGAKTTRTAAKDDEDERYFQDNEARRRRQAAEKHVADTSNYDGRQSDRRAEAAANQAAGALDSAWKRQVKARNESAAAAEREAKATEKAAAQASQQSAAMARPSSWYQRLQANAHARTGQDPRPPSEFPTIRQGLSQGVISAARFGAGAGLLYGGLNTVKEMIKESSDLERVFNQIERQFEATGKAADFSGFRREVMAISKETGQMATEVAFVGFQFQGAFGDGPGGTQYALAQTRAAIQLTKITGLELSEVVDSLTAGSIAYGVSISELGDRALGVQEKFGVQAKETLKFFGDLSSVAAEAGLSLDQLSAIAGVTQQATGKSGASIAEGFARIIPSMQEASVAVVGFYSRTPALQGKAPEVAAFAGAGNTGAVMDRLIRDYHLLDAAQQKQIISLLGGRREAQYLIPLLENSAKYVEALSGAYGDAGKQAQYFKDLQKTLSQQVSELGRQFEAFGQQLFEAGLADLLKDIVLAAGGVLKIVLAIAQAFNVMNQATGGAVLKLGELMLAMKALQALGILKGAAGIGGLLGRIGLPTLGGALGGATYGPGGTLISPGRRGISGPDGPGGFTMVDSSAGSDAAIAAAGGRARAASRAARLAYGARLTQGVGGVGRLRGALNAGNAGLAAAGVTAPLLTVAAAVVVGHEYFKQRSKVQSEANALGEKLKTADKAQLEAIVKDKADFWTRVAIRGSGKELPAEMAAKQLKINAGAGNRDKLKAALDSGLLKGLETRFKGLDADTIKKLLESDAKGDDGSSTPAIERVLAIITAEKGVGALDAALKNFTQARTADDAAKRIDGGELTASVAAAKAAYEAGAISGGDYLKVLDNEMSDFRLILANGGKLTEKQANDYAAKMKDQAAFLSNQKRALVDYNLDMSELGGGGGSEERIDKLRGYLKDPAVTDPKARAKAAHDIVDAQKKLMDERLAMTDSATEQLAIMRAGIPLDDETRVALLAEGATTAGAEWDNFLKVATSTVVASGNIVLGTMQQSGEAALRWARIAVELNISLRAAALMDLKKQRDAAQKEMDRFGGPGMDESSFTHYQSIVWSLDSAIAAADNLPNLATPPGTYKPSKVDISKKEQEVAREAKTKADEAETERKAIARARLQLGKAEHEGDPVALADFQIEEAKLAVAEATKESERITAQAQLVTAQKARISAMTQVGDAYRDLDKALANAAGDTVLAAQYEVDAAEAHLRSAQERGDVLGIIAAKAEKVSADKGRIDAEVQLRQDRIDTGMALERMSASQAIAEYEGILQIPGLTKQQVDSFLIKIHQLRKDASKDLQFDIPSEIKLPTLYEARRLRQSAEQGQGYQDNRQVSVQYNVFTEQDHQAALDDLMYVSGGAPRVGATPRTYP